MKKNKTIFYILAVTSSFCILCVVAIFAIQASDSTNTTESYMQEYGGSPDIYTKILLSNDCNELQITFNQADENLSLHPAGTPQYQWSLGYMKASDVRMREIGCYK